jgi:hypothetical protein
LNRGFLYGFFVLMSLAASAAETTPAEVLAAQQTLDRSCESARANERQELQRRIVEICKSKGRSDAQCQQEAAAYSSMNIRGVAPSSDIPVCVQANDFRKAHALKN